MEAPGERQANARRTLDKLTIAEQPHHSGHVRVVFIISFDEDVLAGVDDGGPRETLHAD